MIRSLNSAASGMEAQQLNIDVIANNLANVNTLGFKKARAEFQDLFYQEIRQATQQPGGGPGGAPAPLEVGQGTRPVATQRIFQPGDLQQTNNELDMAIEGAGFFRVRMPDDQIAYTRAGAFKTDADGQIVNSEGLPMDPPVVIPADTISLAIERDGTIKAKRPGEIQPVEIGQVELSQFVNPVGLKAMGHGLYTETEGSGPAIDSVPDRDGFGRIAHGMVESSNVKVVSEMIDLIAAQRAYEINSRVIRASDEMLELAAQLR